MLAGLAAEEPLQRVFQEASEVLGYDLWALAQAGPAEELERTTVTQPLMLAADVALWKIWRAGGGAVPACCAGHSLGEFAALVCAQALDFQDAIALVRERGRLMQEAVPEGEGGMAAVIGLEGSAVEAACGRASQVGVVSAVNYNAPQQIVVAGARAAVEEALRHCREAGARSVRPLPVSAPFHSALMEPAAQRLAPLLQGLSLRTPQIPVVHNVHGRPEPDVERLRALLIEQAAAPVRWSESVHFMARQGVRLLLECGPGRVLSGLVRRIDNTLQSYALESTRAQEEARQALAALGAAGEMPA